MMVRNGWLLVACLTLSAGVALADEGATVAEPEEDATVTEQEQPPTQPRPSIRVLQHPYDIASFYRSSQGEAYGYGFFGYDREGNLAAVDRYPIARYYRSRQGSRFGYSYAPVWNTRRGGRVMRQGVRSRNELYLFVPAFLAPVGPLAFDLVDER
jgi:hypothetical protein